MENNGIVPPCGYRCLQIVSTHFLYIKWKGPAWQPSVR